LFEIKSCDRKGNPKKHLNSRPNFSSPSLCAAIGFIAGEQSGLLTHIATKSVSWGKAARDKLIEAMRRVLLGEIVVSEKMTGQLLEKFSGRKDDGFAVGRID
jgi:hypothetical protein